MVVDRRERDVRLTQQSRAVEVPDPAPRPLMMAGSCGSRAVREWIGRVRSWRDAGSSPETPLRRNSEDNAGKLANFGCSS